MAVPPSFIKNVALEVDNAYGLQNTPVSSARSKPEGPFIGRKLHVSKLLAFLNDEIKNGVFLVTGYRGMGKTSFVNHVLRTYTRQRKRKMVLALGIGRRRRRMHLSYRFRFFLKWRRTRSLRGHLTSPRLRVHPFSRFFRNMYATETVRTIRLTLAQNHPKEIDILRLIVMSVFDEYRTYLTQSRKWTVYVNLDVRHLLKLLFIPFLILLSPMVVWISSGQSSYLSFPDNFTGYLVNLKYYNDVVIGFSIILVIIFLMVSYMIHYQQNNKNALHRIRWLVERCSSALSEESNAADEAGVPVINIKLSRGEKRTKQYPIATAKEMEYELQVFLDMAFKEHQLEFIFVFDELDKLDAPITGPYLYDESLNPGSQKLESAYERELRDRKQAVINIITGLKNFFTTASAHFIFIAGREMFDASLADISDRQSPISSIFTYVFNIESLLKEKDISPGLNSTTNAWLGCGVEVYLKKLLFGPDIDVPKELSLYKAATDRYKLGDDQPTLDNDKLYFTLQNFVTYLTYRSNGSPKKLIKEIHEFIRVKGKGLDFDSEQTLVYRQFSKSDHLYLYFSYENQYRIGFINYLYRPFLIRYGRSFKLYSDNIIVSTPYLFDHFLKFHPFAFSLSNLELVPEMLSSNKTPSLREHIRQIISYLSGSHIREIEIGLFDYKFYSRTLNEITFLSKIFEQEAAALNYTLDESHLIKLHVRNKIRDLRNTYAGFLEGDTDNRKIASIAHLNGILGDLHFFDQEYDDAIVAYQDAIRPLANVKTETLSMLDFVTLLRNRLKTGLCYEKMSAYELALSSYSDASDDSVRYMTYRLRPGIPDMPVLRHKVKPEPVPGAVEPSVYYSGPLSDLLQIVLQSFISQIYIQEKRSVAGISELKLCMSLSGFLNITGGFYGNAARNHIIKAQAFLQAGNLLYFKNSDRKLEKTDTFKDILPEAFNQRLVPLLEWHEAYNGEKSRAFLGLLLYIMGLEEMVAYGKLQGKIDAAISGKQNIVTDLLKMLTIVRLPEGKEERFRGIYYNYTATLISAIGDCLLAGYVKQPRGHHHLLEQIFESRAWTQSHNRDSLFSAFLAPANPDEFRLQDVLHCYYVAGDYYLRQGKVSNCSFQYKKILYVLRLVLHKINLNSEHLANFYNLLKSTLVAPLLEFADQNSAYGERHMRNKALKDDINAAYTNNNLSNHPETREVWLLYYYIQLKTGEGAIENMDFVIASNNSFATQNARMQELHFYAKFLRNQFGSGDVSQDQAVNYLYTTLSILQIMDIYGSDYWMGYSYLAETHFQTGKFLYRLRDKKAVLDLVEIDLSALMGAGSYASLDPAAHFQKALDYFGRAERLHEAGEEYKDTISDMICLEDDFNDNAYHFGAALDRFKMNNGLFDRRKRECREYLGRF